MLTYKDEDKGPFTGKGELLAQLAKVERERRSLLQQAERLVERFRRQYPRSPVYLARYSDRTLTTLRWRRSARNAVTLDLLGAQAEPILRGLPRPVRRDFLGYEQERVALNARLACLRYEEMRLREWIERLEQITTMRRTMAA